MNVIDMGRGDRREKRPPTLTSKFGNDGGYLELCATWHLSRAQQKINWATHDIATGYGTLPDAGIDLSLDPLYRMQQIEDTLALITPRTALLAQEMLRICIAILSHPDPEETLGQGPVLEIIKNVKTALCGLPAEMQFQKALAP
jgi:hypothetical protein